MQEHHIQRELLYRLVTSDSCRFSELRPKHLDTNVVTYHLQQLIKQKLVRKNEDGSYSLTELGKVAGINITLSKKELLEQAHSVILMGLRVNNNWLLRKRKAQPMYDKIGFVHSEPVAHMSAQEKATQDFKERTGLTAVFEPKGFGYVRLMHGDALESFVHFTYLEASDYSGELLATSRNGENFWLENPDFSSSNMIPSMKDFAEAIELNEKLFYIDKTYQI